MQRLLLTVVLAGVFTTPAFAIFGDSDAHRRIDEQSKQLNALVERLGAVESTLNSGSLLTLLNQIEQLTAELARLRGEIETLTNKIELTDKRSRDLYMDTDGRLRAVEEGLAATASTAPPPEAPIAPGAIAEPTAPAAIEATGRDAAMPASAVTDASTATAAPASGGVASPPLANDATALPVARPSGVGSEAAAYEAAHHERRAGRFAEAAAMFARFVADHPASGLAAPAQYWVGDSLFNARDYRGALLAHQRLLEVYPASPKVPDSMLNMASCYRDTGDAAAERAMLERLIATHPASEAAEKARKRLAARR